MGKHRWDIGHDDYVSYMKVKRKTAEIAIGCMTTNMASLGLFDLDGRLQRFDISRQDLHHLAVLSDIQGHSLLPLLLWRHGGPLGLDDPHVVSPNLHLRPRPALLGRERAGALHERLGPLAVRGRHQHGHRPHLLPYTHTAAAPAANVQEPQDSPRGNLCAGSLVSFYYPYYTLPDNRVFTTSLTLIFFFSQSLRHIRLPRQDADRRGGLQRPELGEQQHGPLHLSRAVYRLRRRLPARLPPRARQAHAAPLHLVDPAALNQQRRPREPPDAVQAVTAPQPGAAVAYPVTKREAVVFGAGRECPRRQGFSSGQV